MHYKYNCVGTCSRSIEFDINNDVITNVVFEGGCNGNLKGISKLVEGKTVDEIEKTLKGTLCGYKNTSCPDQLARAVREASNANK